MPEGQMQPKQSRTWILYTSLVLIVLLAASLIIESCPTEKVEVCDTTTGDCTFEAGTCRPLLFELLT